MSVGCVNRARAKGIHASSQRQICTAEYRDRLKVGRRLRELAPAVGGSQEAEITQPRDHLLADPCTYTYVRLAYRPECLPIRLIREGREVCVPIRIETSLGCPPTYKTVPIRQQHELPLCTAHGPTTKYPFRCKWVL